MHRPLAAKAKEAAAKEAAAAEIKEMSAKAAGRRRREAERRVFLAVRGAAGEQSRASSQGLAAVVDAMRHRGQLLQLPASPMTQAYCI